jgi:hypothetical protein
MPPAVLPSLGVSEAAAADRPLSPTAAGGDTTVMPPAMGAPLTSCRSALDHDVKRRLVGFLSACRVHGREQLTIAVDGGRVRVGGLFHSAHERQLCIENCRRMTGVSQVIDETELAPGGRFDGAVSEPSYRERPR